MAIVTGKLTDFGLAPFTEAGLQLNFYPSRDAAIQGDALRATAAIPASFTGGGGWSVNLAPTDTMRPLTFYLAELTWLNGGNLREGRAFVDLPLHVPAEGGSFVDLIEASPTPGSFVLGYGPPPSYLENVFYIDLLTGDFYPPIGSVQ